MNNKNYSVQIELITPEKAKALLEVCPRNRNPNKSRISSYAKLMTEGKWAPFSPIVIDDEGNLVDGGHRLRGVIESGCEVQMLVIRGLEKKFIPFIDTGRVRSAGDMLSFIEELDGTSSLRNLSSLIRVSKYYEAKSFSKLIPYDEIANEIIKNKDLVVKSYRDYNELRVLGGTIAVASAIYLIRKQNLHNEKAVEEFLNELKHGENLHSGMPTYAARNTLLASGRGKCDGSRRQLRDLCTVLRAWEGFVYNENIKLIKANLFVVERMPKIAIA